jgi:multidrug efflux pump subunit AcrA (membrane-fusion protein)
LIRYIPLRCFAFFSFSGFLFGCPKKADSQNKEQGGSTSGAKGGQRQRPTPVVEVYEIKDSQIPEILKIPVTLEGKSQVEVFSRLQGRIQSLPVASGARVKKGQTLFAVDRSEPGETYLPAPILAPASGFLAQWFVNLGDTITPQTPVGIIVDDSSLRAKIPLPLEDWRRLSKAAVVEIKRDNRTWNARIVSVPRAVTSDLPRAEIEVEIANADRDLRAGLVAQAHVPLPASGLTLVPSRALLLTNEGTFVYVVVGDSLKRERVEFRPVTPDKSEIITPAFAVGTRLVTSGFQRLTPGGKVRIAGEGKTP